jgi:WhiB family redox-sensing transcriptional regulator
VKGEDWRYRAACLNFDPELFFPIGTTGPAVSELAAAQQVCLSCSVREQCLKWAVDHDVEHGVWGGLSEDQRRALRRRTALPRKPVSRR